MLGRRIADPEGIEGAPGEAAGLGLLDVETVLTHEKRLVATAGADLATGSAISGYEMHVGRTSGAATARPMLRLGARPDGACSADGRVTGCYVHGLFASDAFRRAFIATLGGAADAALDYEQRIETTLDALASHLETHLDVDGLLAIAHAR